jgi:hypothetical protein
MPVFDAATAYIAATIDAFLAWFVPLLNTVWTSITTVVAPGVTAIEATLNAGLQTLGNLIQSGFQSLSQSVSQVIQYAQQIAQNIANAITYLDPIAKLAVTLAPVAALVAGAAADPNGAINSFFDWIIDLMVSVWPSTPTQFQFGSIVLSLLQFVPTNVNFIIPTFIDTVNGIMVMLQLFLFVKAVKMLPFFG